MKRIYLVLPCCLLLSACGHSNAVIEQSKAVIEQSKIAEENMEKVREERRRLAEEKEEYTATSEPEVQSIADRPIYNDEFLDMAQEKGRVVDYSQISNLNKNESTFSWFTVGDLTYDVAEDTLSDMELVLAATEMHPIFTPMREIQVPAHEYSIAYYSNAEGDEIKIWVENIEEEERNFRECHIRRLQVNYNSLEGKERALDNLKFVGYLNRLSSGNDCLKNPTLFGLANAYAEDGAGFVVENDYVRVTLMGKAPYGFFWGTSDQGNTLGSITVDIKVVQFSPVEDEGGGLEEESMTETSEKGETDGATESSDEVTESSDSIAESSDSAE